MWGINQKLNRFLMRRLIPRGVYCEGPNYRCPFLFRDSGREEQNNGYCSYLRAGDWNLNKLYNQGEFTVQYIDEFGHTEEKIIKGEDLDFGWSLLWDGCKECGVKFD